MMSTPDNNLKDINMIDTEEEKGGEVLKDNWMDPIIDYLKDSKLQEHRNKARKLLLKAQDIYY